MANLQSQAISLHYIITEYETVVRSKPLQGPPLTVLKPRTYNICSP